MTILGNILVRNQQLMDRWKQTFFLSWGVLRQSMGEMSESLPWLEGAADVRFSFSFTEASPIFALLTPSFLARGI
jgi:hypothetical protein